MDRKFFRRRRGMFLSASERWKSSALRPTRPVYFYSTYAGETVGPAWLRRRIRLIVLVETLNFSAVLLIESKDDN